MKNLLKFLFSFIIIALFSTSIFSQNTDSEPRIESTIYLGYVPFMDGDFINYGFHTGCNIIIPIHKRLYGETQISYSIGRFKSTSDRFHEKIERNNQTINLLLGGRFFFFKKENKTSNIFVNALYGISFFSNKITYFHVGDKSTDTFSGRDAGGYSVGLYWLMKNYFSIGVALETENAVMVKVGYTF